MLSLLMVDLLSLFVGLDFVTEFIDPDGGVRVYECSLCKTFRTVTTAMEHITGYNHRVNYIVRFKCYTSTNRSFFFFFTNLDVFGEKNMKMMLI